MWVFEAAAEAVGVRLRPGAVRDALRGATDPVDVGRALGLRVVEVDPAAAAPTAAVPLIGLEGRPGLLEGGAAGSARVRRADGTVDEGPVHGRWYVVEPATPFSAHDDPHGHDHAAGHDHVSPWTRLRALLRADRGDHAALLVHAIVVSALTLATPVAVQTLVNQVAFGVLLQPIVVLSLLLFAALTFVALVELSRQWTVEIILRRVFVRLVAELSHRLPRMRLEARDHLFTPELVNRFFDLLTVQKSMSTLLIDGLSVVVSVMMGTVLLAAYHPWLLAYAVLLVGTLALVVVGLGLGGPRTAIEESYAKYDVAGWIEDMARVGPTLRVAGGPALALARADQLSKGWLRAREAHFRVLWRQVAALLLLQALASTVLLSVGGWLVLQRELTLGQLVAAELVVGLIVGGFAKAGKLLETLYDLLAALDKLGHLIEIPLERVGGEALPPGGAARVRAVAVEAAGLPATSVDIQPGERVAVVGEGDRAVLLELLIGARTPEGGFAEIDGVDLRRADLDTVRARAALVVGEAVFDGTILENVSLARPDVSDADVRAALDEVGLLDAVQGLPEGLDTRLLPHGRPLAPHLAPRLALARAIAARPGVLLLDAREVAHDAAGAAAVRRVLLDRSRVWTVVVVTDDPALIAGCDRSVAIGGAE